MVLVTGCIIAVLGTENVNGEFDVLDIKYPDLPPQPDRWTLSSPPSRSGAKTTQKKGKVAKLKNEDVEMTDRQAQANCGKIAIVSGLEFSGTDTSYSMELDMLLEYLLGEALDPETQTELSQISRLIVAGNSIAADRKTAQESDTTDKKSQKKYGYDSNSYSALPSHLFDEFLSELLPTMPVTLLPGALDPANSSYPQQPIHAAMFPKSRSYAAEPGSTEPGWFHGATNPWEGEVEGWRVLATGGQNIDDITKYVDSDDRLSMMEAMCRWRCSAPTAPDTLCEIRAPVLGIMTWLAYRLFSILSFSGGRTVCDDSLPSPLYNWLSAKLWDKSDSGAGRSDGKADCRAIILHDQGVGVGGYRDPRCLKGQDICSRKRLEQIMP